MSKLSFRARALDASKPMPIFMAEELPDLPDYSAINRAVPQMPSGMEKEEECEHHLQRAICAGLIIPTPEVSDIPQKEFYDKVYPANYKQPRQLIHMQPFTMEQDIPDYDMDSEDERWLQSQTQRLDLTPLKFEDMMDRLEKSSGQTVVTLNEAKALLKEDDDLIIAVFDYWLNKRLKTQHPLILTVKTEHRAGTAANNPYLAFRRRTEKMQTRKNRKNDETSYEKMLKLRRDLYRAVTLLELVKRREKTKREHVHLTVEVFEKRFQCKDYNGAVLAEVSALKASSRPAFTPIFHNHYTNQAWSNKSILKDEGIPRKEKRQYKKRKHKSSVHTRAGGLGMELGTLSSDEEVAPRHLSPEPEEVEDDGQFAFRRNKLCSYHMPLPTMGNWPWCSKEENGAADKRFRYTLSSLSNPKRCIGFARRRMGRGGRVILDRTLAGYDDFWRQLDFTILEPARDSTKCKNNFRTDIKSEFSSHLYNNDSVRTNVSECDGDGNAKFEIKKEPEELVEESVDAIGTTKDEENEMLEFLRTVRRDWLHFRPKTPPLDYEPPCHMSLVEESFFRPDASSPFSMEIQTLDAPSALLDTSTFETDPFVFDNLFDGPEVPVTDTRQSTTSINLNVNVGLDTLTPPSIVNSSDSINASDDVRRSDDESVAAPDGDDRTIVGCSKFTVSNLSEDAVESRSRVRLDAITDVSRCGPKVNIATTDGRTQRGNAEIPVNANGIIPYEATRMKNNKLPYAYCGGLGYSNTSSGGTLSLHTSAHTLTLNSHSANIFEIPISSDGGDQVSSKLVNSQCAENSGTPANNNKTKNIVRKNNLIMEVT